MSLPQCEELGVKLAKIHSLKVSGLTSATPCDQNNVNIRQHLTMTNVYWLTQCHVIDGNRSLSFKRVLDSLNNVEVIIDAISDRIKQFTPDVFCHNDLHDGNIVKSANGELMIIDFDHANYGYRGYDFAFWLVQRGQEAVKSFLRRQYSPMDRLLKGYVSENKKKSINELHDEICAFVPYEILNRLLAKRVISMDKWLQLLQMSMEICYTA